MKKYLPIIICLLFCIGFVTITDFRLYTSANANTFDNCTKIDSVTHFKKCLPEAVGMNSVTLQRIDSIAKDAIRNMAFPGCQVFVLKDGKVVYNKSFGKYTYETDRKVTTATIYDLASLSKTTGTLLAVMKLYDDNKLDINDKASDYLDFLKGTNKEHIKIVELLFHETGLPAYIYFPTSISQKNASYSTTDSIHSAAMKLIANTRLGSKTYLYSCINFVLLKEIVETISGVTLDFFLQREFYGPMNLRNLGYVPLRTHAQDEIAPTLKKISSNGFLQGEVHDPIANFFGGVSGNAGLFGTTHDVAAIYQMILNNGDLNGKQYLCKRTCQMFTTTVSASGRRGLGFDKPVPANPAINPCSKLAPKEVFGHTGYTGTCCWVDPANKLVYVFLSNRTYPNDGVNKLARMSIRPKIQGVIYQSIIDFKRK